MLLAHRCIFVACFPTESVQDGGFGATEQTASAKMGNICLQEILLQLHLLLVIHDHLYSHCILSALKGKGRSNLFIWKAWMDGAGFKRLWVVVIAASACLHCFGWFWFCLAAFLSGGVHSWRLPVGLWTDHYLVRRHLSDLCSGRGISCPVSL